MTTINKIREILNLSTSETKTPTKLYKEDKLDDGRVIATDGDDFLKDERVYILNDSGEASEVEKGTYTFADGRKINVDNNSKVIGFQEDEDVDDDEKRADERGDKESTIKDEVAGIIANELPDMDNDKIQDIAEKIAKVIEGEDIVVEPEEEAEKETEEMSKETTEDFKKQYIEALSNIANKIDGIEIRLKEIENEPASNGVVHNPQPQKETLSKDIDFKSLNAHNRALFMLKSNLKK